MQMAQTSSSGTLIKGQMISCRVVVVGAGVTHCAEDSLSTLSILLLSMVMFPNRRIMGAGASVSPYITTGSSS